MSNSWSDERLSRFISLVLRHRPGEIGLTLEPGGWVPVNDLIEASRRKADAPLDRPRLERLLADQRRPRFELDDDGRRIRARYGHSVDVDLDLRPREPPRSLYHGTARRFLEGIRSEGLRPRSRRFVHLSETRSRAREVGRRHGEPVVLRIRAAAMAEAGRTFYRPAAGIWLTARVPPGFLEGC